MRQTLKYSPFNTNTICFGHRRPSSGVSMRQNCHIALMRAILADLTDLIQRRLIKDVQQNAEIQNYHCYLLNKIKFFCVVLTLPWHQ
jgi:hypothetical protein